MDWEQEADKSDTVISQSVISDEERIRMVGEGLHSWTMEGAEPDPVTKADAVAFARGELTSDEVVSRTRARIGLD